jgi:hypothetical protein
VTAVAGEAHADRGRAVAPPRPAPASPASVRIASPLLDRAVPQRQVAILAYGSVIERPGPRIQPLIVERRPCRTPFPVEFARASHRWGGGPVLVPCARGGQVDGVLLVLSPSVGIGVAVDLLREREGLPGGRGIVEVAVPGAMLVITASLPRNLTRGDMTPQALARRAIASVARGPRNGPAYLRQVLRAGVRTPLTEAYERALLELSGASSLEEVERMVRGSSAVEGGLNGLG